MTHGSDLCTWKLRNQNIFIKQYSAIFNFIDMECNSFIFFIPIDWYNNNFKKEKGKKLILKDRNKSDKEC